LERALTDAPFDAYLAHRVEPSHLAPLSPIDDIRGDAAYRGDAALVLLRRLLEKVSA
jgi:CO/xanthine dehydrogenase FAD-binding subunit